jgi:hypothetical protein
VELYMEMNALSKKLRTAPSKEDDQASIRELIEKTEASKSPHAAKTVEGLLTAEAAILKGSFEKAATAIGTASLLFRGGSAGTVGR